MNQALDDTLTGFPNAPFRSDDDDDPENDALDDHPSNPSNNHHGNDYDLVDDEPEEFLIRSNPVQLKDTHKRQDSRKQPKVTQKMNRTSRRKIITYWINAERRRDDEAIYRLLTFFSKRRNLEEAVLRYKFNYTEETYPYTLNEDPDSTTPEEDWADIPQDIKNLGPNPELISITACQSLRFLDRNHVRENLYHTYPITTKEEDEEDYDNNKGYRGSRKNY